MCCFVSDWCRPQLEKSEKRRVDSAKNLKEDLRKANEEAAKFRSELQKATAAVNSEEARRSAAEDKVIERDNRIAELERNEAKAEKRRKSDEKSDQSEENVSAIRKRVEELENELQDQRNKSDSKIKRLQEKVNLREQQIENFRGQHPSTVLSSPPSGAATHDEKMKLKQAVTQTRRKLMDTRDLMKEKDARIRCLSRVLKRLHLRNAVYPPIPRWEFPVHPTPAYYNYPTFVLDDEDKDVLQDPGERVSEGVLALIQTEELANADLNSGLDQSQQYVYPTNWYRTIDKADSK